MQARSDSTYPFICRKNCGEREEKGFYKKSDKSDAGIFFYFLSFHRPGRRTRNSLCISMHDLRNNVIVRIYYD